MQIQDIHIAFIGAGNMAVALIEGLLARGLPASNLWASDPDKQKLEQLVITHGIHAAEDNHEAVVHADTVVLAVKPQVLPDVLQHLKAKLNTTSLLSISIAAGVSLASLESLIGQEQAIIRCMPNTPALVQAGASALVANNHCNAEDKAKAQLILEAVGSTCWLENEKDMDTVTALSGSGPAYFFLFIEALRDAAVSHGLSLELSDALAKQTALGAAKLALNSEADVSELRRQVTSPGGTTEAALWQLEKDDFKSIIARAVSQAKSRSEELAQQATGK